MIEAFIIIIERKYSKYLKKMENLITRKILCKTKLFPPSNWGNIVHTF